MEFSYRYTIGVGLLGFYHVILIRGSTLFSGNCGCATSEAGLYVSTRWDLEGVWDWAESETLHAAAAVAVFHYDGFGELFCGAPDFADGRLRRSR